MDSFTDAALYLADLDALDSPKHGYHYASEYGIERARHLLNRLGGSDTLTDQRCVLVAGSKGKGSTVAMLASILGAAGYRTGVFTGPHLHTPLERFSLAGPGAAQMPEDVFVDMVAQIRAAIEDWDRPDIGGPTRFEAYTAMAYRWFARQRVDLAVMEIGIGGRLDAVNLANPIVSIVANISLEHTALLGNTLTEIAREKAGILRPRGVGIVAEQPDEALASIRETAARIGCELRYAPEIWSCVEISHTLQGARRGQAFAANGKHYFLTLLGAHQLQNASAVLAAAAALNDLGYPIPEGAIRAGLASVNWPGRFELLATNPTIIADGAHTPHSIQRLCEALRAYYPGRRILFIVNMLRDKDAAGMLREIGRIADTLIVTQTAARRAASAEQLWAQARENSAVGTILAAPGGIDDALAQARALIGPQDVICVTGSLHLVAAVEKALVSPW